MSATNEEMARRLEELVLIGNSGIHHEALRAGAAALRKVNSLEHALAMNQADSPDAPETWTPRERRLRAALEEARCYIGMYRDNDLALYGPMTDKDEAEIQNDLALCDAALAETPPPDPREEDTGISTIPVDIQDHMLKLGEVEWGSTHVQPDDSHITDLRDTLKITREVFGLTEDLAMQGVYMKGTATVVCHTGISPNSPNTARIIAGLWNTALATIRAAREVCDGKQ